MPGWINVCKKCAREIIERSLPDSRGVYYMDGGPAMTFRQRFWKCDRCKRRKPWSKSVEMFPNGRAD